MSALRCPRADFRRVPLRIVPGCMIASPPRPRLCSIVLVKPCQAVAERYAQGALGHRRHQDEKAVAEDRRLASGARSPNLIAIRADELERLALFELEEAR
jgi:hypothetical protein